MENPLPAPDLHQKVYLNDCTENVIHHGMDNFKEQICKNRP